MILANAAGNMTLANRVQRVPVCLNPLNIPCGGLSPHLKHSNAFPQMTSKTV